MILYRVIIFIDICIIMCIKLFHFILKIRTKQNIHNKTVIKITEPMMPIIPQINPAFALFPLVPLTFWCHRKTNDRCNPNDDRDWRATTTDHAYNCYDSKNHCCDPQFHLSAPAVVVLCDHLRNDIVCMDHHLVYDILVLNLHL